LKSSRFCEVAPSPGRGLIFAIPDANMPYYQDVVVDYLREQRSFFINVEFCIQLHEKFAAKGDHWYCDAVAVDFENTTAYLCEVTYAKGLGKLLHRLAQWQANWPAVVAAMHRDSRIPSTWSVTPWLFIPESFKANEKLEKLQAAAAASPMPAPKITALEEIVPWNPARSSLRATKSEPSEGTTK
jgi:hypothetical protein